MSKDYNSIRGKRKEKNRAEDGDMLNYTIENIVTGGLDMVKP